MSALKCPTHGVSQANPTGFCKKCGARLLAADVEPESQHQGVLASLSNLWRSWGAVKYFAVAVVVLLVVLFVWPGILRPPGDTPRIEPTNHSVLAAPTSSKPLADSSTATIAAPTSVSPSTTTPHSLAPTATQPATAIKIEPARVISGKLPITLTVMGSHLDQVDNVTLNLPNGATATTTFQGGAADQLTLTLSALPQMDDRELTLTLALDSRVQEGVQIVAQDYLESKIVKGVKAEYRYTDRVNSDGLFTRMRTDPNIISDRVGMLYNDDIVDILRDNEDGWYQLRILKSRDPAQQGVIGWIERWLIDDTGVPPKAVPTLLPVARFSARVDVNFEGSGNSGQFRSCVAGRVQTGDERKRYEGALINVNNGPKNSFNTRTGRNGEYRVCGLGGSYWDVILLQVPGMKLEQQPKRAIYVNGDTQEAIVHFFRQR